MQSSKLQNNRKLILPNWIKSPVLFSFISLGLFILFSGVIQPGYLTTSHIMTVVQQSAPLIIVAIGQTFVILTGGIDLSVGSIIIFTDVFCAQLMVGNDERFLFAAVLSLLVGTGFGFINGIGVEMLKIPPLIMTLASSLGVEGLMLLYCGGFPKGGASPLLKLLGSGKINGIPVSMLVWVVVLLGTLFLLNHTKLGWGISFFGSNRRAAQAIGLRVRFINIFVYMLSGFLAALAGLLVLGFVGIPSLILGDDYTMASIAAVILGGTAFTGGLGSPLGTLSGALLMRFILTLLTSFNISAAGKNIVQGLIIMAVVIILTRGEEKNFLTNLLNLPILKKKLPKRDLND
jgi:ribose transport system permease protein